MFFRNNLIRLRLFRSLSYQRSHLSVISQPNQRNYQHNTRDGQNSTNNNPFRSKLQSFEIIKPLVYLSTGFCFGLLYDYFDPKKCLSRLFSVEAFIKDNNLTSISTANPADKFNFIADVVEKISPSVVFIEIKDYHPFFGQLIPISSGSGVIVREDGQIITNAHVVANKRKVSVKLKDGQIFEGVVQFADKDRDLALIKIPGKDLPSLELGRSALTRPGEWVIALGSPFSLTNTITAGVVSSVQRASSELGLPQDMEYIQTDAAINIGNSGGPLVNLNGQIIGINSMKVTSGISFAIPSDYVTDFLKRAEASLKNRKSKGKEGYFGFKLLSLNPNIISALQLHQPDFPDVQSGVLVSQVILGSPAHLSGIMPMDVIISVNGKTVTSSREIFELAASDKPIEFLIRRGRVTLTITLTPEKLE